MKKLIHWLKHYFTLVLVGYAFTDRCTGLQVFYYKDCYGKTYMKYWRWSLFEVESLL